MLRQFVIFLLVALELLALLPPNGAEDFLQSPLIVVLPLQHTHVLLVMDDLPVLCMDMAFREREVIDGIEQIGLSHAVVAEKTVHFRRESDFCLLYVFVIENRKPLEYHLGCINGTKVKNILRSIDYLVKKNYFRALNRLPCGMLRDETLIN